MVFSVYAQADIVSARLVLRPVGTAGALETTVMEAIGAGANTLHDLTGILGLAPRLVLQVVGELWRADRIVVELGSTNETLRLSSQGRDELDALVDDGSVSTTASTTTTNELAFERLTGRVLPESQTKRRVPPEGRSLVIPPQSDDRTLAELRTPELVEALVKTLEGDGDGRGDRLGNQRVDAAFVEPGQLQVSTRRNYVELRAGAQVSATGELTVAVLDDKLSLLDRVRATDRLQAIVDAEPRSTLAQAIRGQATQDLLEPRGVAESLSELMELVNSMDSSSPEERQQKHDLAHDVAEQVVTYAHHLATHEMDARLVRTNGEHLTTMIQLIEDAQHQLVIAAPWVRTAGVLPLRDSLQAALDRGVQVVLLWGIDGHHEGLGEANGVMAAMAAHANSRGGPGRLLYSPQRAARSHAKLVIADDRAMLVTSKNLLSDSDHGELGVLLTAVDERSSPVIDGALRYVNVKAPDPRIARELHRQPGAFGPRSDVPRPEVEWPRLTAALLEENAPESVLIAWRAGWSAAITEVATLLGRQRPTVRLVTDLQHRGLLRDALGASSRALLASDRVSDEALTDDIAEQGVSAAAREIEVRFHYRRVDHAGITGLAAVERAAVSAENLTVTQDPANHAKVVLSDDRVVIGSFNPLSVDAALRHGRSTGELGVAITSTEVSDAVWELFGGSRGRQLIGADEAAGLDAEPAPQVSAEEARLGQLVAEAVQDDGPDALLEVLAEHGFDRVLAAHRRLRGDASELGRIGGAALAEWGHAERGALELVLEEAVAQCNWDLAVLMTRTLGVESPVRSAFVEALADGGGSELGAFLAAYVGDDPMSDAELDALMVVDFVSLLLDPKPDSAGNSDALMDSVAPVHVAGMVEAAVAYLRRFGRLPDAPPPAEEGGGLSGLSAVWSDALEEYESFERYNSKSTRGDAFLRAIFEPGGEMFDLGEALRSRDGEAVRTWQAERVRTKDDKKWLDRAVHAAGIERIVDNRRKPLLEHRRRLRLVVDQLCSRLDEAAHLESELWTAEQLAAVGDLLEQLHEQRSRLSATDGTDVTSRVLAAALDRLEAWRKGVEHRWAQGLDDWPFVAVHLARVGDPALADESLVAAAGRDVATRRTPEAAVAELLIAGELERASWTIRRVEELQLVTADEIKDLTRRVSTLQRATQIAMDDRVRLLELRCERANVPVPVGRGPVDGERLVDAIARITDREAIADTEIARRREEVQPPLSRREQMEPSWLEYVDVLLATGDLVLAEKAMVHDRGIRYTPHPRTFARWSWRGASLRDIAGWFDGDEHAPGGMRGRFLPAPNDAAGRRVVAALSALAAGRDDGAADWVQALQQLVVPAHVDRPRLEQADGGIQTAFYLPYHPFLPRLRWVGGEPITVAVGESGRGGELRLALDVETASSTELVVDVADVLSMLRLASGDETPSTDDRVLRFLTLVAGSLPLDQVIDSAAMPAGESPAARRQLAWLLTILGVPTATVDLERLSLSAGGHPEVLWTLVDRARSEPVDGVAAMLAGPSLDEHLVAGVEADLGRDEDVLVLAFGMATSLLEDGCIEEELFEFLAEDWKGEQLRLDRVRVSEVVTRLEQAGYVIAEGGRLRACGCRAAVALGRAATDQWLAERMELVDPVASMKRKTYELIYEMIVHEQQAEATRLTDDELAKRTRVTLAGRLADPSQFELVRLCRRVVDRFSNESIDVFPQFADDNLMVGAAGPEIWIEALVTELLNNAFTALAGLPFGEASIFLSVERDPEEPAFAVIRVLNNGPLVPEAVREALRQGQRWRPPGQPHRGTGLYRFMTFGELKGVTLEIGAEATPDGTEHTVVQVRVPLATGSRRASARIPLR